MLDMDWTELIISIFDYNSLSYIITCLNKLDGSAVDYKKKCYCLSLLLKYYPDLNKFATRLFDKNVAPFEKLEKSETALSDSLTDFEVVKCCYNLLNADPVFFKSFWNWSIFITNFLHKGEGLQKLYTNHIFKILNSMSTCKMESLNSDITDDDMITFRNDLNSISLKHNFEKVQVKERIVKLNICNKMIVNIENVLLPIFNYENSTNFIQGSTEIVYTSTTRANLRSIAMGITSGRAVCLTGPVGCGKTTLIEFIAGKTGRIFEKSNQVVKTRSRKRKLDEIDNSEKQLLSTNGFLRIQLGDQTDSKMLLGQYKCTDVPGEFIWLPGVLTQVRFWDFFFV